MPYTLHWEEKGINVVFTGEAVDGDLFQLNRDIYGDPRFLEIDYQLADFLGASNFDVSADTVRELVIMDEAASQKKPDMRIAIVSTKLLILGLTRMYSYSGGGADWATEVFEDLKSARKWLGAE